MALVQWRMATPMQRLLPASGATDDLFAGIYALFAANSGAAGAHWEVIEYVSTSPRSMLFARKNGAPGRAVLFGQEGSTPNAAAVKSVAGAVHHIAYSDTSTASGVTGSYLTGAPLSDADYIQGMQCWPVVAQQNYYLCYIEHTDGFVIHVSNAISNHSIASAGRIIEDLAGNPIPAIQASGSGLNAAWATTLTASAAIFPGTPGTNTSYNTSQAGIHARISGSNQLLYRLFATTAPTTRFAELHIRRGSFYPIWLVYNTTATDGLFGKVRQIAFGPQAHRFARRVNVGSPANQIDAYALGLAAITAINPPLWFTNFEV